MAGGDRGVLEAPPEQELATCCRKGLAERAAELLAWGVPPDTTIDRRSVLSIACQHGQLACVRLLLRAKARVAPADLVWAVRSNDPAVAGAIADALFFAGIEYDFWFEDRPLLTHEGFLKGATAPILRWLLDQGADPTETDRQGRDAATMARKLGLAAEIQAMFGG